MAQLHLRRHINDNSDRYLARMNRRWGRRATDAALKRAEDVMQIMNLGLNDMRAGKK